METQSDSWCASRVPSRCPSVTTTTFVRSVRESAALSRSAVVPPSPIVSQIPSLDVLSRYRTVLPSSVRSATTFSQTRSATCPRSRVLHGLWTLESDMAWRLGHNSCARGRMAQHARGRSAMRPGSASLRPHYCSVSALMSCVVRADQLLLSDDDNLRAPPNVVF